MLWLAPIGCTTDTLHENAGRFLLRISRKPLPLHLHNCAVGFIIYYNYCYKEGCATAQTKPQKQVLGILGGLGPAASCYLYQMLIDHTPAIL